MTAQNNPMFCASMVGGATGGRSRDDVMMVGLSLEELQRGMVSMETDAPPDFGRSPLINVDQASSGEADRNESAFGGSHDDQVDVQMERLANQIVAAMPERIKQAPSRNDDGPGEANLHIN